MNFALKALDFLFAPNMWHADLPERAECLPSYKYPGKCGTDLGMRSVGGRELGNTQGQGSGHSLKGDKHSSERNYGSGGTRVGQVAQWVPWLT